MLDYVIIIATHVALTTCFALSANLSVETVSSVHCEVGERVAMIRVRVFPPKLS